MACFFFDASPLLAFSLSLHFIFVLFRFNFRQSKSQAFYRKGGRFSKFNFAKAPQMTSRGKTLENLRDRQNKRCVLLFIEERGHRRVPPSPHNPLICGCCTTDGVSRDKLKIRTGRPPVVSECVGAARGGRSNSTPLSLSLSPSCSVPLAACGGTASTPVRSVYTIACLNEDNSNACFFGCI